MDWLKKSVELEKPLISTCGDVVEALIDELIPQIKLAAYENEGEADVECKISIKFAKDTFELSTEGYVEFPARFIRVKAKEDG
tara:strand:+ start:489 stop:737 length:249 start_codon:yes stop_codon:yes gene_type:complete